MVSQTKKTKCKKTGCKLDECSQQLCPIHLLRDKNEIYVDQMETWIKRTPRQETIARNSVSSMLSEENATPRVKTHLAIRGDLTSDWFEWWTKLLATI